MASFLSKLLPYAVRYHIKEMLISDKKNELMRSKLYGSFIRENDLVFDIGANMGNRITPFLKLGAKVVAVEPQKECISYLKFKFGKKITIVPKALGSNEGVKELHISNTHNTISSFSEEWIDAVKKSGRFPNTEWNKTEKIEMTTFDELIRIYGTPKFAKIDVEGYENEVLKGLTQKVPCLSFEYTVPEQTDKVTACIERLVQINSEIICNYSIGENMELALSEWISASEMLSLVKTNEFIQTLFGDIYIASK